MIFVVTVITSNSSEDCHHGSTNCSPLRTWPGFKLPHEWCWLGHTRFYAVLAGLACINF